MLEPIQWPFTSFTNLAEILTSILTVAHRFLVILNRITSSYLNVVSNQSHTMRWLFFQLDEIVSWLVGDTHHLSPYQPKKIWSHCLVPMLRQPLCCYSFAILFSFCYGELCSRKRRSWRFPSLVLSGDLWKPKVGGMPREFSCGTSTSESLRDRRTQPFPNHS